MSKKIVTRENNQIVETNSFSAMAKVAETLLKSGFLPQAIKTSAQAIAIILTGKELGIPAMQSLRMINVIQGKPTMAAELMLALAYQHVPGFKYQVIKSTATECTCLFERPGHKPHEHTFTIADAQSLGLAGKDNWKKQPAVMLRWRCISSGLRLVAPDAIAGVYTAEEIAPDMRLNYETGTAVDVIEEAPREPNDGAPKKAEQEALPGIQEPPKVQFASPEPMRVSETYKRYAQVKELVKDCEADAIAWCIKNGFIKAGEHMGQVSDEHNQRILAQPAAFLTAIKSSIRAAAQDTKKGKDGKDSK